MSKVELNKYFENLLMNTRDNYCKKKHYKKK